jgi:hypothetical protein
MRECESHGENVLDGGKVRDGEIGRREKGSMGAREWKWKCRKQKGERR